MSAPALKVLFIIPSLGTGGAERQLCALARVLASKGCQVHVAVYYRPGYYDDGKLAQGLNGIDNLAVHILNKKIGVAGYLTVVPKLLKLAFRLKPDLVHGYLGGNYTALLCAKVLSVPVLWAIRRTSADMSKLDRMSKRLLPVTSFLSRHVDGIIYNSKAGLANHRALGFRAPLEVVIPNGIDTSSFHPDRNRGDSLRRRWSVPAEAPLIGIVGRIQPVKDHATFLRAAAQLAKHWPSAYFVCVGDGPVARLNQLKQLSADLEISEKVIWAGSQSDMCAVYNALTVLALTSTDEGFPNVLGEAMACGISCVTTNVGDAAAVAGATGVVASVGNYNEIAVALSRMLGETAAEREKRTAGARERIVNLYSIAALGNSTETVFRELMSARA
jgi:glycosyltransferase involved in cell wall biosynthesis